MQTRARLAAGIIGLLLAPWVVGADADEKSDKNDYTELSRRLQQAIVEKAPKRYEDRSDWGRTIPPPPAVRLPRLPRKVVQVNGRDEFPDGVWKRTLVWLDDPAKDIRVRVLDVKQREANTYRVKLASTVDLHAERERQRWKNGVRFYALTVQADARFGAEFDCDVKVAFDVSKFPPDVLVEPKVARARVELLEFDLNRVGSLLVGDPARELGDELKGVLQELIRLFDEDVKEYANAAIIKVLKDGKARVSAAELLKIKPPEKKAD